MEIKVSINESEIMQLVLKGATERDIADHLKDSVIDNARNRLMPLLTKQVVKLLEKTFKEKMWKDLLTAKLKETINNRVKEFLKEENIENLVQDYVYEIINRELEDKAIKITF